MFHRRTVLSSPDDSAQRPSGEKRTQVTIDVWPAKLASSSPLSRSHRLTILSLPPLSTRRPSGDTATVWTSWGARSEEHTSELQSLRHLVCRLLLEKKKKKHIACPSD